MGTAVEDSMFIYLSNIEEITFDQVWRASGFSNSMDDYFEVKDAKFAAMK